eukprot:Rmarinus@m.10818
MIMRLVFFAGVDSSGSTNIGFVYGMDGSSATIVLASGVTFPVKLRMVYRSNEALFILRESAGVWVQLREVDVSEASFIQGTLFAGLTGYGAANQCYFSGLQLYGVHWGQWREARFGANGASALGLDAPIADYTTITVIPPDGMLAYVESSGADLTSSYNQPWQNSYDDSCITPVGWDVSTSGSGPCFGSFDATQNTIYVTIPFYMPLVGPTIESVSITLNSDGAVRLSVGNFLYEKDFGSITAHGDLATTAEDAVTSDTFSVPVGDLYVGTQNMIAMEYHQEAQDDGDIFLEVSMTMTISINECNLGTHDCGAAECVMSAGSYICQCPAGTTFADGYCTDDDECDSLVSGCGDKSSGPVDQMCINTYGGSTCLCDGNHCGSSRPVSLVYGGTAFQETDHFDSYVFLYKEVTGDFSAEVDLTSLVAGAGAVDSTHHMCGLMVRYGTAEQFEHFVYAGVSLDNSIVVYERATDDAVGTLVHSEAGTGTESIFIAREGSTVVVRVGTYKTTLTHSWAGADVFVGLAATDGDDTSGGTCNVENLRVAGMAHGSWAVASPGDPSTFVSPTYSEDYIGYLHSWRGLLAVSDADVDMYSPNFDDPGYVLDANWWYDFGTFGGGAYSASQAVDPVPDTIYFRREIDLGADISDIKLVRVEMLYDDGVVLYINGAEVDALNMPTPPFTHGMAGTGVEGLNFKSVEVDPSILVANTNVFAAAVQQATTGSADVYFGMEITYDYLDECDTGVHDCSYPYSCFNTVGSFYCSCGEHAVYANGRCDVVLHFEYEGDPVNKATNDGVVFHYFTEPLGLEAIIADVTLSTTGTDVDNMCGLMFRSSLADDSASFFFGVNAQGDTVGRYRTSTGIATAFTFSITKPKGPVRIFVAMATYGVTFYYAGYFDSLNPTGMKTYLKWPHLGYTTTHVGFAATDGADSTGGTCTVRNIEFSLPVTLPWSTLKLNGAASAGDFPTQMVGVKPRHIPYWYFWGFPSLDVSGSDIITSGTPYYDPSYTPTGDEVNIMPSLGANPYGDLDLMAMLSPVGGLNPLYWFKTVSVTAASLGAVRIGVYHDGGTAVYAAGELLGISNMDGASYSQTPYDDGIARAVAFYHYFDTSDSVYLAGQYHDENPTVSPTSIYELTIEVLDPVYVPCSAGLHSCSGLEECSSTLSGGFTCSCPEGTTAGGLRNCEDVRECQGGTHNCGANARCKDTFGSFTCACNTGYYGNGFLCIEEDECAELTHNCAVNAACTNTAGSFTCACNSGYSGNAYYQCADLDECSLVTDDCNTASGAVCVNSVGSFSCSCPTGYSGSGTDADVCATVDECGTATHNCDTNAACSDIAGSFTCACAAGYSGDGVSCLSIDECTLGVHDCTANAVCSDTSGSFTCACAAEGWTDAGPGGNPTCTDIDECSTAVHDCSADATCANADGSFSCACNAGYEGSGVSCSACGYSTPFQYYAFVVTAVRVGGGTSTAAISEIMFSDFEGPPDRTGWSALNPAGFNPVGNEPDTLVDNDTTTRWEDSNFGSVGSSTITVDTVSPQTIIMYAFATSDAGTDMDPVSWEVKGSADQTTWYTLATVTDYDTPVTRETVLSFYACDSVDECGLGTHNCHTRASCVNTEGSFECECPSTMAGNGIACVYDSVSVPTCTAQAHGGMVCL